MATRIATILLLAPLLLACRARTKPPPPQPLPLPMPATGCPGGLLCESPALVDGWRVPRDCEPSQLGQRVRTCWLQDQDWPRLVEFFRSRYPHAVENGPLLRICGQQLPPPARPGTPQRTPPLLLAHLRARGVELVLLSGDPVDMPPAATDTGGANAGSPRRAP